MKFEGSSDKSRSASFTLSRKEWQKILSHRGKVVLEAGEDFQGTPEQARALASKLLTDMVGKWSLSADNKNGTLTINNTPAVRPE